VKDPPEPFETKSVASSFRPIFLSHSRRVGSRARQGRISRRDDPRRWYRPAEDQASQQG